MARLFASLDHIQTVLQAWRVDYNDTYSSHDSERRDTSIFAQCP